MIVASALIHARRTTPEDLEKAFDGVGVNGRIADRNVFLYLMHNGLVIAKILTHFVVVTRFVGQYASIGRSVGLEKRGMWLRLLNHLRQSSELGRSHGQLRTAHCSCAHIHVLSARDGA